MGSEAARQVSFRFNGPFANWLRKTIWHSWTGRRYGLLWHDTYSESKEIVEEAVKRLSPEEYDKRAIRLLRAAQLTLKHEYLPKDQWTKWEDETWYLKPHLDRIKREYRDYKTFTGRKPYWATRASYEQSEH
ncbi:Cytochrome b-c1 complex subunit 7 [Trichinella nativa]|uniref:Cytochrome b-c1 complex subunit 7 n=4 Tax=Trichinella TaxID=6333 RepID=A0A0V1KVI2_9BILA|nr:Cytochrome b-c1 complex subunit 7 [Trichinella murrelli]KRX52565.1 Cytochrome b-c1 complex subunit 7 [Trichinella sp. T9]KRY10120.1 Cytochrome b-c1 complex subunit 7 [Trichinella patagoniensis]KRY46434.1 Cytochrome b-c1 complex subunit 7 [Trichinella britovi]KRZ51332.1 Cytochrome b-c1 complex subunit 7 [Trichinella nativa]KRZ83225.1 Cytochrome b-c1 complex subunit 7 [Trichinella sp. T8]